MLEHTARKIEQKIVPHLQRFIDQWRRQVLWLDGIIFGGIVLGFVVITIWAGFWEGLQLRLPGWDYLRNNPFLKNTFLILLAAGAAYVHLSVRRRVAGRVGRKLLKQIKDPDEHTGYLAAFRKNSSWQRSIFSTRPCGWNKRAAHILADVLEETNTFIQKLNDRYTNPSGLAAADFNPLTPAAGTAATADSTQGSEEKPFKVVTKE